MNQNMLPKGVPRLAGKKILLLVPVLVLLAAGCNNAVSGTGEQNSSQNSNQEQSTSTKEGEMMPNSTENTKMEDKSSGQEMKGKDQNGGMMDKDGSNMKGSMSGDAWQGTLKASNDPSKGNYTILVNGHTIYLKSSQDYSALIGTPVMVHYTGTMDSFKVNSISAK